MNSQITDCNLAITFSRGVTGESNVIVDNTPQVVLAGRSNVGKSSIINSLSKKNPARSAKDPGKTTEINFYAVGDRGFLVDLPGYGYAKISAKEAEKIRKQMLWYLVDSKAPIACVVLVVDVRRGIGDKDRDLIDIAVAERLPLLVLANKIDRCNQSELNEAKEKLKETTGSITNPPDVLLYSAKTGNGTEALCNLLTRIYE